MKKKLTFILIALLYTINIYSSDIKNVKSVDGIDGGYFKYSNEIPEGFENLSQEIIPVDIIYMDENIGVYNAKIKDNMVSFINPKQIVDKINNLKSEAYKKQLLNIFSKKMPANMNLACSNVRVKFCNILPNDQTGIILSKNYYDVRLFVAKKYINEASSDGVIFYPIPETYISVMNNLNFIISKNSNSNNSVLYSDLAVAKNNKSIILDSNLNYNSNYKVISGSSDGSIKEENSANINYQIDNIAAVIQKKQWKYQLGTNNNYSIMNRLLENQSILGFTARTNYSYISNRNNVIGTPVNVFLVSAGSVRVFRNNELIFASNFSAGSHRLNTSSFPDGSYQITVVTTINGNESSFTQFFSKNTAFPMPSMPIYQYGIGLLEDNRSLLNSDNTVFPQYSTLPLYYFDINKLLRHNLAFVAGVTGSSKSLYLDAGPEFAFDNVIMEGEALLGTNNDYGVFSSGSFFYNKLSLNASYKQIWAKNEKTNSVDLVFDPLTSLVKSFDSSISYNGSKFRLSMDYNMSYDFFSGNDNRISIRFFKDIFKNSNHSINFSVSYGRSKAGYAYLFALNLSSLVSPLDAIQYNVSSNYEIQQNNDTDKYSQLGVDLSGKRQFKVKRFNDVNLDVAANLEQDKQSYSSKIKYVTNNYDANLQSQFNYGTSSSKNYVGILNTGLVYTHGHLGITRGPAAALFKVDGDKGSKYVVSLKGGKSAVAYSNNTKAIAITPYRNHSITISEYNDNSVSFDGMPTKISLYKHNVKYYHVKTFKELQYFATFYASNKIIPNAKIENSEGSYLGETDSDGFAQFTIKNIDKYIELILKDGKKCRVEIPKPPKDESYLYYDRVDCI